MTDKENVFRHFNSIKWFSPPMTYCYEMSKNDNWFPDPRYAIILPDNEELSIAIDVDTCVAIGGDLSLERLVTAYSFGYFPWGYAKEKRKYWHAPIVRFVLFPDKVHISHSMRTLLNKRRYAVSINRAFPSVIKNCSEVNDRNKEDGYWLGTEIIDAFTNLYRNGYGVSVEVWDMQPDEKSLYCEKASEACVELLGKEMEPDGVLPEKDWRLVGGLYGVMVNNAFIGDSMFSQVPSMSKIALIALSGWLEQKGDYIIDMQIYTPHLESMGGVFIDYSDFMSYVNPKVWINSPGLRVHPFFNESEFRSILENPEIIESNVGLAPIKIV